MYIVTTHVAFGKRYSGCKWIENFKEALDLMKRYDSVYFCVNNTQVSELNDRYHLEMDEIEPLHEKVITLHVNNHLLKDVKCLCKHPSGMLMIYSKNHRQLVNPETMTLWFTLSRRK